MAGAGAHAERWNRLTGEQRPFRLQPSRAPTIAQGYGGLARFFPGARDELATIDDLVIERVLGPAPAGKVHAFEDQYASTGGQLYELVMGHDRWVADLRPLVQPILRTRGHAANLCCHPYDLCTELIGREAGLLVTDAYGNQLATPLDVERDVAWVGYANRAIYTQVEPVLQQVLQERGFI